MENILKKLTLSTLYNNQKTGEWPIFDCDLLDGKYADRFQVAEQLFDKLDTDLFELYNTSLDEDTAISEWRDEDIPDKMWSLKHEGPVFGFDIDYMLGPHDWYLEEDQTAQGDYVERKKFYIYPWSAEKFHFDDPVVKYFTDMHRDFGKILNHIYDECFQDQHQDVEKTIYKLMVIQYNTPTATENNLVEHRAHNTDRFGPDHCDETLGGLHLGENYQEFQAQNTVTGEWDYIPELTWDKAMWMFGEHSERSSWKPTYHRMIHNPDPGLNTRYSIIFDLQARYKEEN